MGEYQVVEVLNSKWEKDEEGNWNFTYRIVSTHETLLDAQVAHARITIKENHPLLPCGTHKYVILGPTTKGA
jgi:hypothetical protein